MASAVAVLVTVAFLPGAGLGSSGAAVRRGQARIPAGLAAAIHARLGVGAIRSSSAATPPIDPALGFTVTLSADGTTALVGGSGVAGYRGAAYIFHASDAGAWSSSGVPTATLTHKVGGDEGFGWWVALSPDGTTAFVGAPFAGRGFPPSGAIYVFHVATEDAWASSATPKATLKANKGSFIGVSFAVSSDGATLVAGAPFYSSEKGGAYVFHAASEGSWASTSTPAATLSNASEESGDGHVGFSVAISASGATVLISDDLNPAGGGAFVYHATAADAWVSSTIPAASLSDSGSGTEDGLGSSVALSGDGTIALLGAPGASSGTGAADVFHTAGEAAWATTSTPTATLSNAGGSSNDGFGVNLAVSSDGTTALAFAPNVHRDRGAGYVFHVSGEGAWASTAFPTAALTNSAGHTGDNMGIGALSLDGATVLAGAPGVDKNTGAAEVFHASGESSWASDTNPNAILTDKKLAACVVPKLKGMKLAAAKYALSVGRCRLGKVSHGLVKTKKSHGRVLSQSKKPGKRLAIGAKVSLRVGK